MTVSVCGRSTRRGRVSRGRPPMCPLTLRQPQGGRHALTHTAVHSGGTGMQQRERHAPVVVASDGVDDSSRDVRPADGFTEMLSDRGCTDSIQLTLTFAGRLCEQDHRSGIIIVTRRHTQRKPRAPEDGDEECGGVQPHAGVIGRPIIRCECEQGVKVRQCGHRDLFHGLVEQYQQTVTSVQTGQRAVGKGHRTGLWDTHTHTNAWSENHTVERPTHAVAHRKVVGLGRHAPVALNTVSEQLHGCR